VGRFQDLGPLENDPVLSALSEVAKMGSGTPDFLVSLGTGETADGGSSAHVGRRRSIFRRASEFVWEKCRDKQVREAIRVYMPHWYRRLNLIFDSVEPRLDSTRSIKYLKNNALRNPSLTRDVDYIARQLISSLFYFELDSAPERCDGKYLASGRVLCMIKRNDNAFQALFEKLSIESAHLILDQDPLGAVCDPCCFDKNGEFRRIVNVHTPDSFHIYLRQGRQDPCNISWSPFSFRKLVAAQGLDPLFSAPDPRKRRSFDYEHPRKRMRIT
jgi:hypothetical protein